MSTPHVIVIGAGSTGSATAHDLALRGLRVTVIERGEVASGTTGRNHCLLHSGGRYCITDQESAIECIDENMILRKIMPDLLELNDGLFVAITEADLSFKERFLEACAACNIPARDIPVKHALEMEPFLNPKHSPQYKYLMGYSNLSAFVSLSLEQHVYMAQLCAGTNW